MLKIEIDIYKYLIDHKITMTEFSKQTGIYKQAVSRWANGKHGATMRSVKKLKSKVADIDDYISYYRTD